MPPESTAEQRFLTRAQAFAPFELVDGARDRGLVLIADHARNALPEEYGDLGLPASEFQRHIAYDIGVEPLTLALARRLGVPALYATWSRLLIDPNRGEDDPTLVRQLYDGTIVPRNYPLSAEERERRTDLFYRPYHDAVGALVASVAKESGKAPLIISIHSFTPAMRGRIRPWHVGVLWDRDPRAARPLIAALSADTEIVVGDNEPYDGALRGDTLHRHATTNGYPHALIEVRQDLIADAAGAEAWAARLAPLIDDVDRLPDIHRVEMFGSRTDP